MKETINAFISLIRVRHWIKNIFVLSPAFFAGKIDLLLTPRLLITFFSFCLASSFIYVFNDVLDIERDKIHPEKCKRPLASEVLSTRFAIVTMVSIILIFIIIVLYFNVYSVYVMAYLIMNIAYSLKLKEIAIIDVSCISAGFVLRVLAGGAAAVVYVSPWLVTIVFLVTIAIAFAKRRDDLVLSEIENKAMLRKSLSGYSIEFLNISTTITLSITLAAYIIYTISPEVISRVGSDKVYITSFFVFLGIMRYLQITIVDQKSGSPIDILWKDRFIQFTIICWLGVFTILLYGRGI